MDVVAKLHESVPTGIEVKRLAGRMVWLREADREWLGPAEEALERLRALEASGSFWSLFVRS